MLECHTATSSFMSDPAVQGAVLAMVAAMPCTLHMPRGGGCLLLCRVLNGTCSAQFCHLWYYPQVVVVVSC